MYTVSIVFQTFPEKTRRGVGLDDYLLLIVIKTYHAYAIFLFLFLSLFYSCFQISIANTSGYYLPARRGALYVEEGNIEEGKASAGFYMSRRIRTSPKEEWRTKMPNHENAATASKKTVVSTATMYSVALALPSSGSSPFLRYTPFFLFSLCSLPPSPLGVRTATHATERYSSVY